MAWPLTALHFQRQNILNQLDGGEEGEEDNRLDDEEEGEKDNQLDGDEEFDEDG